MPGEELGKLEEILKECVNLQQELQVYDERKKEFDHAVDATRYALAVAKHMEPAWLEF